MKNIQNAIENDNDKALAALIVNGLDVNLSVDAGIRPLHLAADCNAVRCIRVLIKNGAIVNSPINSREGSGTPLHFAARSGHPKAIKALLDAGANPASGIRGPYGTPLDILPEGLESCRKLLSEAIRSQIRVLNQRYSNLHQNPGPQTPAFQ
jgi:cytohesin